MAHGRRTWANPRCGAVLQRVIVACAVIATVLTIGVAAHVMLSTPGGPALFPIYLTAITGIVTTLLQARWRRRLAAGVSHLETADRHDGRESLVNRGQDSREGR